MTGRRQEIVDAALRIADERGLAGVSMRAVAERVGVTPMALYPHVGSKAALLDDMVGRLLGDLVPAMAAERDWAALLSAYARQARGMARLHPWAVALLFGRPAVTPEAVRFVDSIYTALLAAGVPAAAVPRVERMVGTFVLGFGASEAGGRFGRGGHDPRGHRGRLASGDLPGHAALARWLDRPVDWDAEFEADLADLHRMIAAIVADEEGSSAGRPDSRTLPG